MNNLELSGTIWSYLELSGATWSYLELSEAISSYLELSGAIWSDLEPSRAAPQMSSVDQALIENTMQTVHAKQMLEFDTEKSAHPGTRKLRTPSAMGLQDGVKSKVGEPMQGIRSTLTACGIGG